MEIGPVFDDKSPADDAETQGIMEITMEHPIGVKLGVASGAGSPSNHHLQDTWTTTGLGVPNKKKRRATNQADWD